MIPDWFKIPFLGELKLIKCQVGDVELNRSNSTWACCLVFNTSYAASADSVFGALNGDYKASFHPGLAGQGCPAKGKHSVALSRSASVS